MNTLTPIFYLFPVLYIQYVTGYIHKEDKKNSAVQTWFILETFVFVSQLFGGIIFMFFGNLFKLQPVWNNLKNFIVGYGSDGELTIV